MNRTLHAVWTNRSLWLIHVVANGLLLAAIYGWLWIPDQTVIHLALSALAAVAMFVLTAWLHGSTLQHFRVNHEEAEGVSVRASFTPSVRRIVLFALWLLALLAAILLVLQLRTHLEPTANRIASALTLRLRRPVTPASVAGVLATLVEAAAFMLIPFLFLLVWNRRWSRAFVLSYVAVFIVCAYVPYRLIWWVPGAGGIYGESVSLAIRFGLAYLLAITGWLVLASALGQVRARR